MEDMRQGQERQAVEIRLQVEKEGEAKLELERRKAEEREEEIAKLKRRVELLEKQMAGGEREPLSERKTKASLSADLENARHITQQILANAIEEATLCDKKQRVCVPQFCRARSHIHVRQDAEEKLAAAISENQKLKEAGSHTGSPTTLSDPQLAAELRTVSESLAVVQARLQGAVKDLEDKIEANRKLDR